MQDKRRWLPRWQRVELVEKCLVEGMTRRQAAEWRRVSVSTVQYWVARYRDASDQQRHSGAWADDRPCTPHRQPTRCSERVHDHVCRAAERTGWGPRLIASELQMSHATVSRCLAPRGLSRHRNPHARRLAALSGPAPATCCRWTSSASRASPGPDTASPATATAAPTKSAHGPGWEFCHSIIDDHSHGWSIASCTPTSKPRPSRLPRTERSCSMKATGSNRAIADRQHFSYMHNSSLRQLLARRGIQHRRIPPGHPSATARSSDTSRRSPESGPTGSATAQATPEPKRYRSG